MPKITTFRLTAISSLIFGFLSVNANADLLRLPHMNTVAHPPHFVVPNLPTAAPLGLSPAQISKAYGFTDLGRFGAGQTIAIIDAYDAPTIENDLSVFNSTFGLNPCTTANGCFTKIYAGGSTAPQPNGDWANETTLDVEWAHAIAPNAKILLVEATTGSSDDLMQAVQVATQHGANFVSMSYGSQESPNETGADAAFKVPNVTFIAASGDSGNGANYPAASPYVISVGGTTLTTDIDGNYVSETAWAGSSGGLSKYETASQVQQKFPLPMNPNKKRGIPDVAYNAGTAVAIYDSYPNSKGQSGWLALGGTSAGAPQWAALLADANSASFSPPPLAHFTHLLYIGAKNHYDNDYHDITTGTNGTCGYYCTAQVGYDYITGLGSPKVVSLVGDMRTGFQARK